MDSAKMSQRIELETGNSLSDSDGGASGGAFEFSETNSSSSTDTRSSTSCASDSDELQLDTLESAKLNNEVLKLPRGLCENAKVFHEFFSVETWNILPEAIRIQLEQFLPNFKHFLVPQEANIEKQRTLLMLLNGNLKRFGHSPLIDLQHELEEGNYRPDVLSLRQSIAKSRRREQRFLRCERYSQLGKDLFLSRERLLRTAHKSAPDDVIHTERNIRRQQTTLHADTKLCTVRSRKRFRKEMDHITEKLGLKIGDLSADEEEFSGGDIMDDLHRSMKADIATALNTPTPATDRLIFSTLFKRRHEFTDEDAIRADQHTQQPRLSNRNFRTYIREHKRRKLTDPTLPDFETSDIRLRDVCARAQMGSNFKHLFGMGKTPGRKPKTKFLSTTGPPALVPIQSVERISEASRSAGKESNEKLIIHPIEQSPKMLKERHTVHFQHLGEHSNATIQHPFLPEDGAPFNILDGEVELQQEEVQTYGTCEETLPRFVISNEIVLPAIEQNSVPPQKLLQTPHKEENGKAKLMSKFQLTENKEHGLTIEQNIPRLEPLLAINRTPMEKVRSTSQPTYMKSSPSPATAAVVSPIKRQTLPIHSSIKPVSPPRLGASAELIQETHACFFSLIRDLFCATSLHRMPYNELRSRIDVWLRNPITALNDWYAHADNWSVLLMPAINFLAGDFADQPEEYVPYIEFKPQQNIFQWIGAGRDSDTRLSTLCNYWLQRRYDVSDRAASAVCHNLTESSSDVVAISPCRRHSNEVEEAPVPLDGGLSPPPPPPPRFPTTWTVCAATCEEVIEFQRQERERFEQPHRAYTYRMHGYESVVGPVKGIYTQMYALTKARGHSMMIGNRPNFVTILTLVRDATARLPNGEGTRADIAELLKSSQYINLKEGENVLQTTVSGALDRMHTEHDPCVRYDPKRKIWIYLHRNRSEEDFERIHQQHQGIGKSKKVVQRKPKTKGQTGAKAVSEITDNSNVITTGSEGNNVGIVTGAICTSKSNTAFSMPALVPANPIIVSSQSAITQQKVATAIPKSAVNRSLPVPPLKYNIPHQQQKSLLKSTIQSHTQRQHEHRQVNNIIGVDTQQQHNQRVQQRQANITKKTPASEVTVEENKVNKQLNGTMSPAKSSLSTLTTGGSNSTPIVVATPTGLQTVHVSNTTVMTSSAGTSVSLAAQQPSAISATFAGKKVALNKPIIINQIRGQSTISSTSKTKVSPQQIFKQNAASQLQPQKHTHGFIIPMSMANAITHSSGVDAQNPIAKEPHLRTLPVSSVSSECTKTIYMENSQFISNMDITSQEPPQPKQTQAKNIIRLVPSISSSGVKSILQSTSTGAIVGTRKQPVHVIGHRVLTGGSGVGAVRAQTHQSKSLGNVSLMSSSDGTQTCGVASVVTAAGGSTLIKMSPQTFATLQQKQGQHIVVKQSSSSAPAANQQQRVIDKTSFLKNTSIVTQSVGPTTQKIGKTVFMQQTHPTAVLQKPASSGAASVGSQTSSTPASSGGKVHTINATNLTSQQQRALLQNIKQHQQHQQQQNIQYKTVQVVSSGSTTPQTQTHQVEQSQMHQVISRSQTLTVLPSLASAGCSVGQQANSKAVAVMVPQAQGLPRILKATTNAQSQPQAFTISTNESAVTATTAGGTRILTTSSGQIISLESLLQKQNTGGSLKISSSGSVGTIVKNVQTANTIQQQQQPQHMASPGNTTYTVVSQARSSNTQRINAAQVTDNSNIVPKTTLVSGGTGRILVSAGGQLTAPQIAKVITKTGTTSHSVSASSTGGNIRVIKNATNIGSLGGTFNITNFQGKQVVFATKPGTTVAKSVGNIMQSQQIQTAGMVIGGQTVKLQRNQNKGANSTQCNSVAGSVGVPAAQSATQMQTVIMGNQILRVQQMPTTVKTVGSSGPSMQQRVATLPVGSFVTGTATTGGVVINSSPETSTNTTTMNLPKTVVLGSSGQTIRLQQSQHSVQTSQPQTLPVSTQIQSQAQSQLVAVKNASQQGTKTSNVGRVVLAVQGGGQIFLSPNFQGSTLNLKSLQNMKVVSLTPRTSTATGMQPVQDKPQQQQSSGGSNS